MSHLDDDGEEAPAALEGGVERVVEGGIAAAGAFGSPRAVVSRFAVPPDCAGKTAPEVLAHKVRRLGLPRATSVVQSGDLRLVVADASRALAVDEVLPRGAVVELWRLSPDDVPDDDDDARAGRAPRVLLERAASDARIVVVDKPGDLAIHPSARYLHRTLTGWLRRRGYAGVNPCHRLDRETSGVVVCASGDEERRWKIAFQAGRVEKEYLAVVRAPAALLAHPRVCLDHDNGDGDDGRATRGAARPFCVGLRFSIDAPLALQGERGLVRIKMIVDVDAGAAARTDVEVLQVVGARALVRCAPRTGRQHQIRAHLAAAGCPIVGDKLYAMGDAWFDAFTRRALDDAQRAALDHPRQALHASRVRLDDVEITAPFPAELARLLA